MAKMTENSRKVFEALKAAGPGVRFTTKQMQEMLGFEKAGSVTGSVTGLCKKKINDQPLAERIKEVVEEDGKSVEKSFFYLTEAGMLYDPDAAE